jgi:hypothetical protein
MLKSRYDIAKNTAAQTPAAGRQPPVDDSHGAFNTIAF